MSTLANTSSTYITFTDDDGNVILIKKAYLTTEANGSVFVLRWHDKEFYALQFESRLDYVDITAPTSTDINDLQTIIQGWIGNTGGIYVSKYFQPLTYTGVLDSSNKTFNVTDSFVGQLWVSYNGIKLQKDNTTGYTLSGTTVTLAAALEAPAPTDAFEIWGNK